MATAERPATPSNPPDHGHDSAPDGDRFGEDGDTCRICRGEGTPEEPLFYPCKCSGSIKFVHQECLMEWLSHSQKKYCELCKTPFRFTKLYHPGMPAHIPTSVFLRRAALHVVRFLLTLCRGLLVSTVWFVVVPYCMRLVWRSLFWVGDGGMFPYQPPGGSAVESVKTAKILGPPLRVPPPGSHMNLTSVEPTVLDILKQLVLGLPLPLATEANNTNTNISTLVISTRRPSLLSNVSFFHCFSSDAANRFLMDVVEGMIITLCVVVAFILIFLIREWVVQQQPVINMAALNQDAPRARVPEPAEGEIEEQEAEDAGPEEQPVEDGHAPEDAQEPDTVGDDQEEEESPEQPDIRPSLTSAETRQAIFDFWQDEENIPEELKSAFIDGSLENMPEVFAQLSAEERRILIEPLGEFPGRNERFRPQHIGSSHSEQGTPNLKEESDASGLRRRSSSLPPAADVRTESDNQDPAGSQMRPNMPARDRSFIATEIRRHMEEGNTWSFANAPEPAQGTPQSHQDDHVPDSWEDEEAEDGLATYADDETVSDREQHSEGSGESWQQVSQVFERDVAPERSEQESHKSASDEDHDRTVLEGTPDAESSTNTSPGNGLQETPGSSTAFSVSEADREEPASDMDVGPEPHPDVLPEVQPQVAEPPRPIVDRVLDWMFRDIEPDVQAADDDANDEHIVEDLAAEAPFVPFALNEPREPANAQDQDADVAAAAAQAGINLNDQEAIDEAEDLEGIMELIGVQGPLIGLFQNAMFSAVLISATLACAVWIPYLIGKLVLLVMGSPISLIIKLPIKMLATLADIVVDFALLTLSMVMYWSTSSLCLVLRVVTLGRLSWVANRMMSFVAKPAMAIMWGSVQRIGRLMFETSLPHPDQFRFSMNSHAALRTIQNSTSYALNQTGNAAVLLYENVVAETPSTTALRLLRQLPVKLYSLLTSTLKDTAALVSWLWASKSYKVTLNLDVGQNTTSVYTDAEPWTPSDRMIAILAGYTFIAVLGALYLKHGSPLSSSRQGRRVEAVVTEILQQAGGVLKVILIISIEMLVFPLYCGLLLDVALLPLFQNATLYTRWQYACSSPWTSGFVHWFIGTCYMFHFALFVSMCRKIMRKGVLYFIRDPDDPTFHPVRDVLERSVTTQLRKIAFSAIVYGALVIVCLGGVVWCLARGTTGVLPIHWSSQAPSVEFPLNLLVYNFLTPFIINVFKPSDGLQLIYEWWFKACARLLRLSNFLFGEKVKAEEGHHVRRTWSSWFRGEKGDPENPVVEEDQIPATEQAQHAYFEFDGKYVRAPASDQTRIPKGETVFVEVDRNNQRKDGKTEGGVHNTDAVMMVYVPPWFRIRIVLFVLTIWIFAAATGVSFTIVPLLFGRYLFSFFLPPTVEKNDIHALTLGLYTLGSVGYGIFRLYKVASRLDGAVPSPLSTMRRLAVRGFKFGERVLRLTYVWITLVFVIPLLIAMLLELYFLIPLHAYIGPKEPHVVPLVQDWTLGFLYARVATRMIFTGTSRAARAFSAVVADGYLNPNARVATRCFLLPVLIFFSIAVLAPATLAWTLNRSIWLGANETTQKQVWRFSFPLLGLGLLAVWLGREGVVMLNRWRMVVRDEVYLIGERLHNFGDRKAPQRREQVQETPETV